MPFWKEHAARLAPPDDFERFARKQLGPGVFAVLGIDAEGRSRVQSLRFSKDQFTPEQARAWLALHGFHAELEEAREETVSP